MLQSALQFAEKPLRNDSVYSFERMVIIVKKFKLRRWGLTAFNGRFCY